MTTFYGRNVMQMTQMINLRGRLNSEIYSKVHMISILSGAIKGYFYILNINQCSGPFQFCISFAVVSKKSKMEGGGLPPGQKQEPVDTFIEPVHL